MTSLQADELLTVLNEISEVQDCLMQVLQQKRNAMTNSDTDAMQAIVDDESAVVERLQACHDRRAELIAQARQDGLDVTSLRELAKCVSSDDGDMLAKQINDTAARMRSLQHETLTNWVIAQRTVLHVAQMLELIASGGRPQPTYGKGSTALHRGNLMDQEA